MRHVGLVALEALLIATLVWIAAMTLAGASQSGGLVGAANAGKADPSLSISGATFGVTAVVTADPGDDGTWVHATCVQESTIVLAAWTRVDHSHHASIPLGRSTTWRSGGATCTAEEGYFSTNGRWRVLVTTAFDVKG